MGEVVHSRMKEKHMQSLGERRRYKAFKTYKAGIYSEGNVKRPRQVAWLDYADNALFFLILRINV